MSGTEFGLALSVFLACAVEAVEALTIVLAVGSTRSWRSALYGVGAAVLALAVVVAALGPALTALPIDALRMVVGALLLVFGLQWLRKAILRAAGRKALHDEARSVRGRSAAATQAGAVSAPLDPYSFVLSFKGVLLEGLEVVFIVLTFGATQQRVGLAAAAAALAVVVVTAAGLLIRAPLQRVPENQLKFVVGVMLTSFGIFWSAEGAGAKLARRGRRAARDHPRRGAVGARAGRADVPRRRDLAVLRGAVAGRQQVSRLAGILGAIWEFVVGDDWVTAVGVVVAVALTAAIAGAGAPAWWVMPSPSRRCSRPRCAAVSSQTTTAVAFRRSSAALNRRPDTLRRLGSSGAQTQRVARGWKNCSSARTRSGSSTA